MKTQCLVLLCLALARSATVPAKVRGGDIPVEVIYEDPVKTSEEAVPSAQEPEKDAEVFGNAGVENLHEKSQLSVEELSQASIHLPIVNPEEAAAEEQKVQESSNDIAQEEQELQQQEAEEQKPDAEEEGQSGMTTASILRRAEEIVFSGLSHIKTGFEKAWTAASAQRPSEDSWRDLNTTLKNFFEEQYKVAGLKQQQPPANNNQIIQNIVNGFSNITNAFSQAWQQNQPGQKPVNGSEDEQTQKPPSNFAQSFIEFFSGGVQNVVNNINNIGSQTGAGNNATVLGDTGTGAPPNPTNFFGNVISTIQQVISGANQGNPIQSINLNQSDTGSQAPSQQGSNNIFQGAINQLGQVVNNFRPTPPPGVQGDTGNGTTPGGPFQGIIQGINSFGNQIGQAINQGNTFFGGQGAAKPPEDEGAGTTQAPNFIQNIGNVIQQANPFRPQGAAPAPGGSGGSGAPNPIEQVQQGAQVVQSQIQQLAGTQGGANPIQSIQNAISAVVSSTASTEGSRIESTTPLADPAKPEPAKPEPAKPEPVKPEPAKPEPAKN